MKIIPAIDILNGKCVRLFKGNYSKVTEYNNDPLTQVDIFKKAGFKTIHIVDLNAAKTGDNENLKIIKDIANIEDIEIQVGGGIRTIEKAKDLISNNVKKIIVGTAAIKLPGYPLSTPLTFQAKIRAVTALLNGVTTSNPHAIRIRESHRSR